MNVNENNTLLRKLPSVSRLLTHETVALWLQAYPRTLVTECLRRAVSDLREQILQDAGGHCGPSHVSDKYVLSVALRLLEEITIPHVGRAINATGIILHTSLGRAVWPAGVVDSMIDELKGYVTLAIDRTSGERAERDELVEYILTELTGAEAATVVNNNAAATMLVLAALAKEKEVIISRGQLIEIGGSFRLPDVMEQSGARLHEVGATNRTHLRDYQRAITGDTAMIMRAHPSNFRIVGFTAEVALPELAALAHEHGLLIFDDLGAGALLDLAQFGLPHEPTAAESITAGADIVIFSGDKLIGASQAGIIIGRKELIERIRKHPLARAFRVDKTCLMALERTLYLFRDPERLIREHPTYRMLTASLPALRAKARKLAASLTVALPALHVAVTDGVGYLGSGSLPMHALPTALVSISTPELSAESLAGKLRMYNPAVFIRVEDDVVMLDVRTLLDGELPIVVSAVKWALQ